MHDDRETLSAPSAGRRRGGWRPVADALMTAAFVASVLAGIVGAVCLAVDGKFGMGHLPAYIVAAVLGGLSLWASVWVFLGALEWERSEEAGG